MKKTGICVFMLAFSMLFPIAVLAEETEKNCFLEYTCTLAEEETDFDAGEGVYSFATAEKEMFLLREGEKHTFFICDGQYVDAPVKIIKDTAYVPLFVLIDDMGFSVKEETNGLSLNRGEEKIFISSRQDELDASKMLRLRDVSEALGAEVTYTRQGVAPLGNPVISVDFRESVLTEEEALEEAKEVLTSCLEAVQENGYAVENKIPENPEISAKIEEQIAHMKPAESVMAGYYILEGPGLFFVEKSTGEVYQKTGSVTAGDGSYGESIRKVDKEDAEIFAAEYDLG